MVQDRDIVAMKG